MSIWDRLENAIKTSVKTGEVVEVEVPSLDGGWKALRSLDLADDDIIETERFIPGSDKATCRGECKGKPWTVVLRLNRRAMVTDYKIGKGGEPVALCRVCRATHLDFGEDLGKPASVPYHGDCESQHHVGLDGARAGTYT